MTAEDSQEGLADTRVVVACIACRTASIQKSHQKEALSVTLSQKSSSTFCKTEESLKSWKQVLWKDKVKVEVLGHVKKGSSIW